jgi:hypothetical protein
MNNARKQKRKVFNEKNKKLPTFIVCEQVDKKYTSGNVIRFP